MIHWREAAGRDSRLAVLARGLLLLFLLSACESSTPEQRNSHFFRDLPEIRERGRLVALTGFGATHYFLYKGRPRGYDYELLSRLGDSLGLPVEIRVIRDQNALIDSLLSGAGDLIAGSLTRTRERARKVDFCLYHDTVVQVLVQRKPENWRKMKRHAIEDSLVRNVVDLAGKQVHVRRGSSYYHRLENLADEIGGEIHLVEVSGETRTEELIRRVAEGEIEYTVADEPIARLARSRWPGIDSKTKVSFPQRLAWAVRPDHDSLRLAIDDWLEKLKRTPDFNVIRRRYFDNNPAFRRWVRSPYSSLSGGGISEYDSLLQLHGERLDWDWRLLASQVYQESRFDPRARSWAGARGLMQLLPETALAHGAENPYDPGQNLAAGTDYLLWLQRQWDHIEDPLIRRQFVLASYNVGLGHVHDAQRLAAAADLDSLLWDEHVATQMLRLEDPAVYNREEILYGYCRGSEPVNYVRDILDRYIHYVILMLEEEEAPADSLDTDVPEEDPRG